MSEYPEHDKLALVEDETQVAYDFYEALMAMGIQLMEYNEDLERFFPAGRIDDILARWKGIDLKKIDDEKRLMLHQIREGQS